MCIKTKIFGEINEPKQRLIINTNDFGIKLQLCQDAISLSIEKKMNRICRVYLALA